MCTAVAGAFGTRGITVAILKATEEAILVECKAAQSCESRKQLASIECYGNCEDDERTKASPESRARPTRPSRRDHVAKYRVKHEKDEEKDLRDIEWCYRSHERSRRQRIATGLSWSHGRGPFNSACISPTVSCKVWFSPLSAEITKKTVRADFRKNSTLKTYKPITPLEKYTIQ
ncbi:hypothetical protein EAI_16570 [Harpegnathos saltator]|uniref:Uncharacterized protein n=1 Tax=Harpegnathos saltator TaxID=610380 RepID=E2BNU6_HARSA|nr:hypothetical protein EAI_16570 [Harpegnathos saltator]